MTSISNFKVQFSGINTPTILIGQEVLPLKFSKWYHCFLIFQKCIKWDQPPGYGQLCSNFLAKNKTSKPAAVYHNDFSSWYINLKINYLSSSKSIALICSKSDLCWSHLMNYMSFWVLSNWANVITYSAVNTNMFSWI